MVSIKLRTLQCNQVILIKIYNHKACDPAGPAFNDNEIVSKDAAKNVQCIHTSADFGNTASTCHQDWKMGTQLENKWIL